MVSYIVAISVFILASSFLVNFLIRPPSSSTSDLDFIDLKSRSSSAMDVIMGTAGYPERWADQQATTDGLQRLGLIEEGATIRINASKFDRVARGSFLTQSSQNGVVDYPEAKAALGLSGYDFHLRAYPVFDLNESGYGVIGMLDYDVAYIGDFSGATWSDAAKSEAYVLDTLNVSFTNGTRSTTATGDVFEDDKQKLKQHLVPLIGNRVDQTIISEGSGTKYDLLRVNASAYSAHLPTQLVPAPSKALALSSTGSDVGYTKNREIRAIAGAVNMSGLAAVSLTWSDWVDTDKGTGARDDGDYGWLEVSGNNGTTWCTLTYAQDGVGSIQTPATAFTSRNALVDDAHCPGTASNANVLVAFHWVADNDNNVGHGWVIDDLKAWDSGVPNVGNVVLNKNFEAPEYDLLVLGSNIDQNELTPNEIKDAIRDYVQIYGGRIVVFGGQTNTNWLQPLFHVGTRGASPGVATPDVTHPLLTTPNDLDYTGPSYAYSAEWDFTGSSDEDLFTMIVGTGDGHVLSASTRGAFGSEDADGAVMLTTYKPYSFVGTENFRFLANTIMYGKYNHLYLEMGPEVPTGSAVASATRNAVMDITTSSEDLYSEMAFVLYLWPGQSTATTQAAATLEPLAPRSVTAETKGAAIWVNFTWPASNGTTYPTAYDVWRGNSPSSLTHAKTIVPNSTWTFKDTNVSYGQTYYYNVTANNTYGTSAASLVVSATPVDFPGAPTMGGPLGGFNEISVPWTAPASNGGGTILGYRVWHRTSAGTYDNNYADLGSSTSYLHTGLGESDTRYYKVQALNAAGYGANSSEASGTTQALAGPPQSFQVTNATAGPNNLTLTWAPPASLGTGSLTGYKIWVSDGVQPYTLLVQLNSALNVSFQHNGLGVNATRHYKVQAVTSVGDGANTSSASAKTYGAPDTPVSLTATPNVILHTVTLTWVAPWSEAAIVKYDIWRGAAGSEAYHTSVYAPATTLVGDTPGAGPISYKVYAVSAAGTSNAAVVATIA